MNKTVTERSVNAAPVYRVDPESPWLGLRSFDENCQSVFFGRDQEIEDLRERVLDHRLTVLFGHSGLGKTSLLKAGLMPALRASGWHPIFLRLAFDDSAPPLRMQVVREIDRQLRASGINCEIDANHLEDVDLWELLHDPALGFVGLEKTGVKLVLIFDQFEEVWTLGKERRQEEASAFMLLISALVENRAPLAQQVRLNSDDDYADRVVSSTANLRLLFSLREDYLHWLERWRSQMPSIMDCRVELTPLSTSKALQAVLEPGKLRTSAGSSLGPIIDTETARAIVRKSAGVPPLLSLICERLNARRISAGQDYITADKLESRTDDVLREFYISSFHLVPQEVRHFVEDRLVSESGVRESMNVETAERELVSRNVSTATDCLEQLVAARVLTIDYRGGISRVELTHDLLVPFALHFRSLRREEQKALRLQAEQSARRYARLKNVVAGIVVASLLITSTLGFYAWSLYQKVAQEKEITTARLVREAKLYSTIGSRNWEEWLNSSSTLAMPLEAGKSKWAQALANWSHSMELVPAQTYPKERVLQAAAMISLGAYPASSTSSSAKKIWASESDRYVAAWEKDQLVVRKTANLESPLGAIDIIGTPEEVVFDPSDRFLLARFEDGQLLLARPDELTTKRTLTSADFNADARISAICFVPKTANVAVTFADNTACLWDLNRKPSSSILFPAILPLRSNMFDSSGNQLVTCEQSEQTVRVVLRSARDPNRTIRIVDVHSEPSLVTSVTYDSKRNRLLLITKTDLVSAPDGSPGASTPYPSPNEVFYSFDLAHVGTRDPQTRMHSITNLGRLPISFDQLQFSPDSNWMVARVLRYSGSSGCKSGPSPGEIALPPVPADQEELPPASPESAPVATSTQTNEVQYVSTRLASLQGETEVNPTEAPSTAYYLMLSRLDRSVDAVSSSSLNNVLLPMSSAIKSCCFSQDSAWLYVVMANGSLEALHLDKGTWTRSGSALSRCESVHAIGDARALVLHKDRMTITNSPRSTPLISTLEISGNPLLLRKWRGSNDSGVLAVSSTPTDLFFHRVQATTSTKVSQLNNATLATQCISPYDQSGRIACDVVLPIKKTVIFSADNAEIADGPSAQDMSIQMLPSRQVGLTSRPEWFASQIPLTTFSKSNVHSTTSVDGHWQINPYGPPVTIHQFTKVFETKIDPEGDEHISASMPMLPLTHQSGVAVTLSHDGQQIEVPQSWKRLQITHAEFTPDSQAIAIAHADGLVSLWDLRTLEQLAEFPNKGKILSLQIDDAGQNILVLAESGSPKDPADPLLKTSSLLVWDISKKAVRFPAIDYVERAYLSGSANHVLYIDDRNKTIHLLNCRTQTRETLPLVVPTVVDMIIDANDQYAYVASNEMIYACRIPMNRSIKSSQFAEEDVRVIAQSLSELGIDESTGELTASEPPQATVARFIDQMNKFYDSLEQQ